MNIPPPLGAELPLKVTFSRIGLLVLLYIPPPLPGEPVELPLKVTLLRYGALFLLYIPAPLPGESVVLSLKVTSLRVGLLFSLYIPAPADARLPLNVRFARVGLLFRFHIPPPPNPFAAYPPRIVKPSRAVPSSGTARTVAVMPPYGSTPFTPLDIVDPAVAPQLAEELRKALGRDDLRVSHWLGLNARFVGALQVVRGGLLDRIAGVAEREEVGALDDAAVLDVEAGDDASGEHYGVPRTARIASGRRTAPVYSVFDGAVWTPPQPIAGDSGLIFVLVNVYSSWRRSFALRAPALAGKAFFLSPISRKGKPAARRGRKVMGLQSPSFL